MKTIAKLILCAGAAVALTSQVVADEPFMSPRAKANQIMTVPRTGTVQDLARGQNDLGVAAKSKASGGITVVAGATKNDPDLAHGVAVPGSPRAQQQLKESGREFQVAPLK